MPRKITIFLILAVIIGGVFSPIFSQVAYAFPTSVEEVVKTLSSGIAEILLAIGALILALCGNIFNFILSFTIVNFAEKINDAKGLGGAINNAWATLRDVGNMVFIFILLWAAIRLILGLGDNIGKTIRNIIIVGLLINFSLFFTKVVIDASNIATIGFYNSIMAGAGSGKTVTVAGIDFDANDFAGIFIRYTGVQTFFDSDILKGIDGDVLGKGPFIVGIMGFITMMVLAIVLLVAAVMFLARFILLIFLMILSPIALVGYALPALSGRFQEWWEALKNQAFFAPFFMLLIWVAIKVMVGVSGSINITGNQKFTAISSSPLDAIGLMMNFVIVIGLIIAALILSKQMAAKTKGFGAIAGGVATAGFGVAALTGRQTLGRYANRVASDEDLKARAARGDIGARMKLATARGVSKGSFDVRGMQAAGAGNLLGGMGKATGKGGFSQAVEEKAKRKAVYSKEVFGQTSKEKELAEDLETKYKDKNKENQEKIKEAVARGDIVRELAFKAEVEEKKKAWEKVRDAGKNRQIDYSKRIESGLFASRDESSWRAGGIPGTKWLGNLQGGKEAARKIREQAKGASTDKRIADLLQQRAKESGEIPAPETPTPAPSPTPGGTPTGGGTPAGGAGPTT